MSVQNRKHLAEDSEQPRSVKALVSFPDAGVLVVNRQEQVIACSPEAGRLLRLQPARIMEVGMSALPPALQKIIRRDIGTNPSKPRSSTFALGGATPSTLRVRTLTVRAEKTRREIVVVVSPAGVARRTEQNLARLDRLADLGTLSAGMAHEIKNALVSVKTFVDLLLEKNRDAELTEVVRREIHRIDTMVGQMVKFAGPARPEFSAVRVHDVLDHSLRMVKAQIEGRLISLNRAFNAVPDLIEGDDYQLEQAFVNLLLNAIEAMGPSGSLTIVTDLVPSALSHPKAASAAGAHLRVAIADTGVGITPENMRMLFEPFFTTKQQGTGLGLTIARRIVQEHRGDIRVQSQVNKGTTFNVLLPLHAQPT